MDVWNINDDIVPCQAGNLPDSHRAGEGEVHTDFQKVIVYCFCRLAEGINVPDFSLHFCHFGKRGKRGGIPHSGIQIFPADCLIQRTADIIMNLFDICRLIPSKAAIFLTSFLSRGLETWFLPFR